MNQRADRSPGTEGHGAGNELDALRRNPAFQGPVEPLDEHDHANDHFALIYEGREEQFDCVVPFMRQGLDRNERCMYIADEHSREEVLAEMRARGVDVDAAIDSNRLSIHASDETYLTDGSFDPDDVLALLTELIADAEADYESLRVAGEMTWVFGEEPTVEDLVEYEGKVNNLFAGESVIGLCQYDRSRFPAAVVRDVVRTHPMLITNNVVSHNLYYTPPEEFLGPDDPAAQVDRMLGTLRERTEAKSELREYRDSLRDQNRITGDPNRDFEEKLQALFELGCDRFDLDLGAMARVDADADRFEIEHVSDDHDHLQVGLQLPLSETYCRAATAIDAPASIDDPETAGYDDVTVYQEFGLRAYLGTCIEVDGATNRTFFFVTDEPRSRGFTEDEREFLQLMGQWVKYELEHRRHEQDQRRLYEIAADTDRSFEEKIQSLFEFGCERFDLDLGGMARIDRETDRFIVERVSGDHEHLQPDTEIALSETYCRVHTSEGQTAGIADPVGDGFEGSLAYEEFGVNSYLGTRIGLDDDLDRTLFFVSTDPRTSGFTEAERTFLDLMGQWVGYELERRQHKADLEDTIDRLQQSNDRLKQFAYAASHDLQEPLRMVSSYLQLLDDQHGDDLDDTAREYVDFAVDGAERMREMVDDLLAYSRVEHSGGEFDHVDTEHVVDRVRDDLQARIAATDATITVESLPTVRADGDQLEQLFRNLVSNGIKYNEGDPTVEIAALEWDRCWEFSVTDDGIGLDPGKADRIFEVFKRLHHDDEYAGTGIGLSLCQEIVENHGGDIWVESEPGTGSTFHFTLPRSDAQ